MRKLFGLDPYALKSMTNKISYLDDGELCMISKNDVAFYDLAQKKINKKIYIVSDEENNSKKVIIKTLCQKKFLNNLAQSRNV